MAISWTTSSSITKSSVIINDVCWAPGLSLFVAVGQKLAGFTTSCVFTSPDGVTWTTQTASQANTWKAVVWSPSLSLLVAVASDGVNRVMTSTNGTAWTNRVQATALHAVAWSPELGLFAAVGGNAIQTSIDGSSWSAQVSPVNKSWRGVAWNGSLFVSAATNSGTTSIMTSANGTAWSGQSHPSWVSGILGNGLGASAQIAWLTNKWCLAARTDSPTAGNYQFFTSPDGATWTARTATTDAFVSHPYDVVATTDQFVSVANVSSVQYYWTSSDGITWTRAALGNTADGASMAFSSALSTIVGFTIGTTDIVLVGTVLTPSLSPASGTAGGGNTLTINGDQSNGGFVAGLKVFMDPHILSTLGTVTPATDKLNLSGIFTEASNVTIVNDHQITCTVPPGIGVSDVMVLNANSATPNVAAWFPAGYTFLNPTLSGIVPSHGPGVGGTFCTITGTNLFAHGGGDLSQSVRFGPTNYANDVVVVNATTITCTAPFHLTGTPNPCDVSLFASVRNTGSPFASTNPFISYPESKLTLAYTYDPLWWAFEFPDLEDLPLDFSVRFPRITLPTYPVYTYNVDPPECPLLFLLHWRIITQSFYNAFVDPHDPCRLNLPSFSWPDVTFPWGWTPYTPPPTDRGWWLSVGDKFAGAAVIVSNSIPKDSRTFREIADFAKGSASMLGGFPGTMAALDNRLIYAPGGYTVGTTVPTLRIFDGSFDREVGPVPKTAAGGIPRAILTTLAANGTIYLSTLDSGTLSTDYVGRVFSFDLETGTYTIVGAAFPAGHVPYALAWHMGRLWCGTNCRDPLVPGKVYFFRPGVDTSWVLDTTLTTGGVTSLLSFKGLLYVGTSAPAGTFAPLRVRDAFGAYTTSDLGTGGVARENNCYLALTEYSSKLYASYWNPDTTAISKVRVFDGTTWSTSYTGSGSTLLPFLGFPQDQTTLLAIGGGVGYSAALIGTTDGTTWVNRTAFLTQGDLAATGLPAFGVVVR